MLCPLRIMSASRNESLLLDSVSYVNWMDGCKPLRTDITCLIESSFIKQLVSPAYCFEDLKWFDNVGTKVFSSSTINILDNTGPKGEPIATPSVWM